MPATIEVTGTFPAYQVTVRGTLLEILDATVDPERIGPRRPVGIASDTGAQLVYLDGDLWCGHLGIVAVPEALPSGRLSVGATYDDSLGNRRRWDGTAWRALGGLSSPDGSTLVSTDPIVAPNLARSKSRGLWMPGPAARATTASTSGFATQCIFKAPHRFNRVRLAFGSMAGGAAYNVTKLVVAATNTADSMIPSVGETVTENPTTGLVTGIPSPLAVASNASTLVSKVYTPWINIPAIEAADGSFYFLARYEFSGVGPTYISGESGGWAKDGTGNYWRTKRLAAAGKDYCGADSAEFGALAAAAAYQTFSHIVEAQFGGCEDGQISVAAFGASTMTAGGDNYGSFIEAANGLAFSRKLGMSFVDVAYPGITTSAIYDHLVLRGIGNEYDVILMPVFSSNDGFTDGLVKLQLMRAFSIREQAAAYGQKVLFVVLPHDGAAATPELLAIRQAAEARLFAAGGVVDLCPIVQGASRYAWSSAYSDDGIHPNVAGRNKLRAEAPDVIFAAIRKVLP